jgi:hypothetical protein
MIHYSCDRCKRLIDTEEELRYSVKLEVSAAMEPVAAEDFEDDRGRLQSHPRRPAPLRRSLPA